LAPGPLLTADWADVPRVVPADPKPVPVQEEGAAPAPGLPKVERVEAAPAEPALVFVRGVAESAGQPSIETLAGEAPVYSIEVPNAPPAATFVAPDTVSNGLAGGEAALLGRVIDINPARRGPVPDAWLTVVSAADLTARARTLTDAQGRYRVLDVEPGGYFVVAEKAGLGKTRPQYVLLTTNMGPGVDLAFYTR
jgi:hypothetical protein